MLNGRGTTYGKVYVESKDCMLKCAELGAFFLLRPATSLCSSICVFGKGYRFCKVSIYANLQYVVVVPLVEYSMCCNVVVFERLYATLCVLWFKDL